MTEIDEIKQKLDIIDVIGQYVSLKKSGKNHKGLCPFHSEKTPSFMVNQELQIYKCFGCNEGGDMFSFVQKIEGYDFRQALEVLAEKAGVKLANIAPSQSADSKKYLLYEINETAKKFYHVVLLKHPVGKDALRYLTDKRQLTKETIVDWELGFAPDSWDTLRTFLVRRGYDEKDLLKAGVVSPDKFERHNNDKFRNRIIFPLTGIDGKVLGFGGRALENREPKYLNTQETTIYHKEHFLFGLHKTRMTIKTQGVVLVEGYMDAITAYQSGITNVAAICGTALTVAHLKVLSRYTKDITYCFDADTAGVAATLRAIELGTDLELNIKVALMPEGIKDIDELASKNPAEGKKAVANAIPAYDFVIKIAEAKNDVDSAIGKKKFTDEVCTYLAREKSQVVVEHYAQIMARKLASSPEAVLAAVANFSTSKTETPPITINNAKSPQEYLLALIFSQPTLDKSAEMLHNLTPEDLSLSHISSIYAKMLKFVKAGKDLSVKTFINTLTEQDLVSARDLSLWDVGIPAESDKFVEELTVTVKRIKKESAKRKMADVSQRIREAELTKDTKTIEQLTDEFNSYAKEAL